MWTHSVAGVHQIKVLVSLSPRMRFYVQFRIATNQVAAAAWGLHIAFLSEGINQNDKVPHRPASRVKTDQHPGRESELGSWGEQ